MKLCYVAQNKLYLFENGKSREIPCQRIEKFHQNLQELKNRNDWKSEGTGAKFQQRENPYAHLAENAHTRITSIAAREGALFYAVDLNGETGGVSRKDSFELDAPEGLLLSSRSFDLSDLFIRGKEAYASLNQRAFERHIIRLDPDTGHYDMLTSGDTIENHPVLSRDGNYLYYDAIGIAYGEVGQMLGKSPSEIMKLDLRRGEIESVLSDEKINYRKLTEDEKGGFYVMSRPYEAPKEKRDNPLGCLLGVFYVFKGIAMFFAGIAKAAKNGKSNGPQLATNAGIRKEKETVTIEEQIVDIEKTLAENTKNGEQYPGIVPSTWKLEYVDGDGKHEVIARGVMDYQLDAARNLYYTNGRHLIRRDKEGNTESLVSGKMITQIAVLE